VSPRPSQIDTKNKTLTGLPNFPSFPFGHSTFIGAAETILVHLIPSMANTFVKYADHASVFRLYGAIHYRKDCEVCLVMGKAIRETENTTRIKVMFPLKK